LTETQNKDPTVTDYLASATLSYAIIYIWLRIVYAFNPPWALSYFIYFMAGAAPTYLVLRRIDRNQLPVALIASVINWGFTFVCLIAFTQGSSWGFFKTLLVMYLAGGIVASIIAVKKRLEPKVGASAS